MNHTVELSLLFSHCITPQPASQWHLSVQIGATALFFASSCYASKQHCNSIANFCKWCFFLQWTFWNTVSHDFLQRPMLHCLVSYLRVAHCIAPSNDVAEMKDVGYASATQCRIVLHHICIHVARISALTYPHPPPQQHHCSVSSLHVPASQSAQTCTCSSLTKLF